MAARKEFFVGRTDTTPLRPPLVSKAVKSVRFGTYKEAVGFIAQIERHDPKGVLGGHYYIDAPEWWIDGRDGPDLPRCKVATAPCRSAKPRL